MDFEEDGNYSTVKVLIKSNVDKGVCIIMDSIPPAENCEYAKLNKDSIYYKMDRQIEHFNSPFFVIESTYLLGKNNKEIPKGIFGRKLLIDKSGKTLNSETILETKQIYKKIILED